jgi:uncharacterized protein (UPF0371 family)
MGVNRAGFGITDDRVVRKAAEQEIVRRYFRYRCEYAMGLTDRETVQRVELLMSDFNLRPEDRPVVAPARNRLKQAAREDRDETGTAAALMLMTGEIVTGRSSLLMHAPAAAVLNAVKSLAGISDGTHLLSPATIDSIRELKHAVGSNPLQLDLEEVLVALSVSAATSNPARQGMNMLPMLRNCEAHLTHMPSSGDESGLRTLGVNVTSDPLFSSGRLFEG